MSFVESREFPVRRVSAFLVFSGAFCYNGDRKEGSLCGSKRYLALQ